MMSAKSLGKGRPVVAAGGLILMVSLFLPWSSGEAASETAWQVNAGVAVLALGAGVIALAAAATNGRMGLFRPDVSMSGGADLFCVATTIAVGAVVLFDLADPGPGAIVALLAAAVTACVCADWRPLKGAPLFPRV
jgi:peptidoglycan/LPS O-acetylase OafA/YrhL